MRTMMAGIIKLVPPKIDTEVEQTYTIYMAILPNGKSNIYLTPAK